MKSRILRAPEGTSNGGASEPATLTTAPTVGAHASAPLGPIKIAARDVSVFYGDKQAL
ncbi:MAG TPA: phosphate ABC transporter ATP-binding protein, partial [Brevundimonas sp.]|nr:phosphate ABC transporter ATP-binding protein [Brevundimonas sp.]